MDYIGNKCPVCDKYFHADDDIVVCPDCGTPHHRDCYEAVGHCKNEALHGTGYDYNDDSENNTNSNVVICRSCGKENEKGAFFCKFCAAPLSKVDENRANTSDTSGSAGGAQNANPFAAPFMDPMGGVASETDMGDGVTAGELAKYVKQNTPYFMRVFNNIQQFNRSRFSFVGALFGGGYLLYRKMYSLGTILTTIQAAMLILSAYIEIHYASVYENAVRSTSSYMSQWLDYFNYLAKENNFVLFLPFIMTVVTLIIRITIGLTVNRMYFKHCKQQIAWMKADEESRAMADTLLQTRGGVNMPLAISLLITNILIRYLPSIILGIF